MMVLNSMKEFKTTSPTTTIKRITQQNKHPMFATWNQLKQPPDEGKSDTKS